MTPSTRYLTKSRFKLAVSCPAKLYYTSNPNYKSTLQDDAFMAALAEGGFQVGELAKLMYPGGIEISASSNHEAEAQSRELLQKENVTLFEPAIRHGDFFIRVDVLVKRGNTFELIEVKAKSWDSSANSRLMNNKGAPTGDLLPYLQDVAFQTHVLRLAYPGSTINSLLLMPDKAKTAPVDGLNQMFKLLPLPPGGQGARKVAVQPAARQLGAEDSVLTRVPVDEAVSYILNHPVQYPGGAGMLPDIADQWAQAYRDDTRIPPHIGSQCGSCEFRAEAADKQRSGFHECWQIVHGWSAEKVDQGTVLDIWNFRRKDELIAQGILRLDPQQLTKENLRYQKGSDGLSNSERQWLQVAGLPEDSRARGYYVQRDHALKEMMQWVYPLHFIDFETSMVALPFNAGRKPYEQIAFQFSHHVLDAQGRLAHQDQFLLAKPGIFPNYDFVRALMKALSTDQGSVFMWSPHERTVLRQIADQLKNDPASPEDSGVLLAFIASLTEGGPRQLIDLRTLAQKAFFYPSTRGSCSIKKVLPAVLQGSPLLKVIYGQTNYGGPAMPSLNFKQFAWWTADEHGVARDPYDLLRALTPEMLDRAGNTAQDEEADVADGGAAAMAYARLQFEDLSLSKRNGIEAALLRYCELDTLAMAMVVQAWKAELAI